MERTAAPPVLVPERAANVYRTGVAALVEAGIPFLVGGAYALRRYTGIDRHTKDFDIFLRPADATRALEALALAGFRTGLPFPHWLGKAYGKDDDFIDVIFRSGNGMGEVDDLWFRHSVPGEVLGLWLPVCPAEEMLWSKAFISERERHDGADVAHLLRATAEDLDWDRLVCRFGAHWRVLLGHLIMFGYIYPAERGRIPVWVMQDLTARLTHELIADAPPTRICRGTLLSREQYLVDIEDWKYADARMSPDVGMSSRDIRTWTDAIERKRPTYEHCTYEHRVGYHDAEDRGGG